MKCVKFAEQDSDTREMAEGLFAWDRIARWFTELRDLKCGKKTLLHALRSFGHLANTLGFRCEATTYPRLKKSRATGAQITSESQRELTTIQSDI